MLKIVKNAKLILYTATGLIVAKMCSILAFFFLLKADYELAPYAAFISFLMLTIVVVINNKDQFLMTDEKF